MNPDQNNIKTLYHLHFKYLPFQKTPHFDHFHLLQDLIPFISGYYLLVTT